MLQSVTKPRVAVIGLSLETYKEAVPGYMDRLARQLDMFQAEIETFADFSESRLCFRREHVIEAIKHAEADDVDALLLIPLSYTASLITAVPLAHTLLPVIIWNTQEAPGFDSSYSFDDLLMNHVAQGTQDLTNVLFRSRKSFGLESGHYRDRLALLRLAQWHRAARAARAARRLRVGLLGGPFQDMGDFGVDETRMATAWGPCVIRFSPAQLVHDLDGVVEADVRERMQEDRSHFDIDKSVTEELHYTSVRLEVALRRLVERHALDALSLNFMDLIDDGRLPTLPFLGLNKLLAEGLGYAGEGNVTLAAHMAQMRQLSGTATFTEIYTVDYTHNRMVMTHMQECNPALARKDRRIRLVRKDFWAPGVGPYVGMHFTLEPGPVTLTTITCDPEGRFFYITYETQILDMPPFPDFDQPHWVVSLDESVGDFLTRYSRAGGMHHLVAVPGHEAEAVAKLACLQGVECVQL